MERLRFHAKTRRMILIAASSELRRGVHGLGQPLGGGSGNGDQSAAVGGGPSDHVAGFMIAVGTTVKPAMPKGGQLALSEVVVQHRFA